MWWISGSIQEYILRSWSLGTIGTTAAQKKLFINLRRMKVPIQAQADSDLRRDQVELVARALGVPVGDVVCMNRRLGGDVSLNAPVRPDVESGGDWQDRLVDDGPNQEESLAESEELRWRKAF